MPKVLCECGCGLMVSVRTVRRHLDGKARIHIRASTGRWDTVTRVVRPRHSQKSAPQTRITAHPEPVPNPQDAHDIAGTRSIKSGVVAITGQLISQQSTVL